MRKGLDLSRSADGGQGSRSGCTVRQGTRPRSNLSTTERTRTVIAASSAVALAAGLLAFAPAPGAGETAAAGEQTRSSATLKVKAPAKQLLPRRKWTPIKIGITNKGGATAKKVILRAKGKEVAFKKRKVVG